METAKAITIDYINSALIIASCVAAHYFPYHLLIISYAFLGPAHYLTQISWLHDRRYFANSTLVMPALLVLTLLLLYVAKDTAVSAFLLSVMVVFAIFLTIPPHRLWRVATAIAGLVFIYAITLSPNAALFIVLLLPTVLHVFIFTLCFMWAGALRSRLFSSYLALAVLLVCALTFAWPVDAAIRPHLPGLKFFVPLVHYLNSLVPMHFVSPVQVFGFLSFVYTYHYLNWFSKVNIIRWHHIPRRRMLLIAAFYLVSIGVYAYDYVTGFYLLLVLSALHVFLELPLNVRTFALIGRSLMPRKAMKQ